MPSLKSFRCLEHRRPPFVAAVHELSGFSACFAMDCASQVMTTQDEAYINKYVSVSVNFVNLHRKIVRDSAALVSQRPGVVSVTLSSCSCSFLSTHQLLITTGAAQVGDTSHAGAARDVVFTAAQFNGANTFVCRCVGLYLPNCCSCSCTST